MNKNKFRASYSVLSLWASGNWENAIRAYFKLGTIETKAMKDGKRIHEEWGKEIIEKCSLPKVFGGKKLNNPEVEKKIVIGLADWIDLVGVIDCVDDQIIYEFKTGKKTSENYANEKQVFMYGLLLNRFLGGFKYKKAEIWHYDQTIKKCDMSIVYFTDKIMEDTENWIIAQSGEMHNYCLENKLYEQLGGK